MTALVPPSEADQTANARTAPARRRSRRGFLTAVSAALPAAVVGAALGPKVAGATRPPSSGGAAMAGPEAAALRRGFLQQALTERAGEANTAVLAEPRPQPLDLPALRGSAPPSAGPEAMPAVIPVDSLGDSAVVRMQSELKKAMGKPIDQRKWAMAIDLRKCIGCSACTVACKAENHLPPGVVYRPVIEEEIGEYPNVSRRWLPRPCQQCEDPPCVDVCPVGATWKREDGIVVIDYEACIGCRYCLTACPYGARYFDFGDNYSDGTPSAQPYEESASPEYGKSWPRDDDSPVGNARKCQFCIHRLNAGMLPACVTTCIGGATYFGDKNDPESLISELIASPRVMRLKEELGTHPKVYYLI